mgnify:FL=1
MQTLVAMDAHESPDPNKWSSHPHLNGKLKAVVHACRTLDEAVAKVGRERGLVSVHGGCVSFQVPNVTLFCWGVFWLQLPCLHLCMCLNRAQQEV